jgi:hypothetical protein
MKSFLATSAIILLASLISTQAQDCTFYFPVKAGSTMEMKNYNAKDKVIGSSKSVVKEKIGNTIKFSSEAFDDKEKSLGQGDYEVRSENGEFVIDMNSYLRGIKMTDYKDMDVKIDTKALTLPSNLQPGLKLNDGEITMKVASSGFTVMNMTTKITNRKVEGYEDITTPAGTFKCVKISADVESKMMFKVTTKTVEWISQQVGVVRTESRDSKDKIQGYSVLTSYKE